MAGQFHLSEVLPEARLNSIMFRLRNLCNKMIKKARADKYKIQSDGSFGRRGGNEAGRACDGGRGHHAGLVFKLDSEYKGLLHSTRASSIFTYIYPVFNFISLKNGKVFVISYMKKTCFRIEVQCSYIFLHFFSHPSSVKQKYSCPNTHDLGQIVSPLWTSVSLSI